MEKVGFIGLGNMGAGMAANIQKAGYQLVVYDIREEAIREYLERGARLASSPADMARECDVTFTSLPGPAEVEAVATGSEGVLAGIQAGAVYVDLSTSQAYPHPSDRAHVPPERRPRAGRAGQRR